MASVLGRKVLFGYDQFPLSVDDVIHGQVDLGCINSESLSTYRAAAMSEFLMLRHGILATHADFTRSDIRVFIRSIYEDLRR